MSTRYLVTTYISKIQTDRRTHKWTHAQTPKERQTNKTFKWDLQLENSLSRSCSFHLKTTVDGKHVYDIDRVRGMFIQDGPGLDICVKLIVRNTQSVS